MTVKAQGAMRGALTRIIIMALFTIAAIGCALPSRAIAGTSSTPHLSCCTYATKTGWSDWADERRETERVFQGIEALKIDLADQHVPGSVWYRVYVAGEGWGDWVSDQTQAGSTSSGKHVSAIQVKLTQGMAKEYDVWYRVRVQGFDLLDWAKNGQAAGVLGDWYCIEDVAVTLSPKNAIAQQPSEEPFVQDSEDSVHKAYAQLVQSFASVGVGEFKDFASFRYADVYGDETDELLMLTKNSGGSAWRLSIYTFWEGTPKPLLDTQVYGDQSYVFFKDSSSFILSLQGHGGERTDYYQFVDGGYKCTMSGIGGKDGEPEYRDGQTVLTSDASRKIIADIRRGDPTYVPASAEWSQWRASAT